MRGFKFTRWKCLFLAVAVAYACCGDPVVGSPLEQGRAQEIAGDTRKAVEIYAEHATDHAYYSALVRLLRQAQPAEKVNLLRAALPAFGANRPYQAIKAAEELSAAGAEADAQELRRRAKKFVDGDKREADDATQERNVEPIGPAEGQSTTDMASESSIYRFHEDGWVTCYDMWGQILRWQYFLRPIEL